MARVAEISAEKPGQGSEDALKQRRFSALVEPQFCEGVQMFSKTERLILLNQYTILQELQPTQQWEISAQIIQEGLTAEYGRLTDHLYEPLAEEDCRYVGQVLAVYDALQRPYADEHAEIPKELTFPGFDGNNESSYLGYARFMMDKLDRWSFLKIVGGLNSHHPTTAKYTKMIRAWEKLGEPHILSGADAEAVLKA